MINNNNNNSDLTAWSRLVNFGNTMLLAPPRGGKKQNLTNIIKSRSAKDDIGVTRPHNKRVKKTKDASLAASVTSKIEDGNIKAALRLLSSEDKPADDNEATITALKARHLHAAIDRKPSPPPRDYSALHVSEAEVVAAVKSFPAGSAGGPDGIRPQHILDLVNNREAKSPLFSSLTNFVHVALWARS